MREFQFQLVHCFSDSDNKDNHRLELNVENDSNFKTEWLQRHYCYQTVIKNESHNKPFIKSNLLRYKSHNTISIPKQFIRNNVQQGEWPRKAYRFWHHQALRSPCLKGHVRARGSTLWRHHWQEASEFLCTKTPLFGAKNIAKNPRKCSLRCATNVMFSRFRRWRRQKINRFETVLRAVLIN